MKSVSSDSYKAPLVRLSFDSADALRGQAPGTVQSPNVVQTVTDGEAQSGAVQIPMHEYIERFSYTFGEDEAFMAEFTLFDPDVDNLLALTLFARANGDKAMVYFDFGWIVDGGRPFMSDVRAGGVIGATLELLQHGARLVVKVSATDTFAKTLERADASWPATTPGHEIVRTAIENYHPSPTALNAKVPPPRVLTPVRCKPLNTDNAVIMANTAPIVFVRSVILPQLVADEPGYDGVKFTLIDSDTEPGTMILAPEGWRRVRAEPKRIYNVGRGQDAQVISFSVSDSPEIVNSLGGSGRVESIDARSKQVHEHNGQLITKDPTQRFESTTDGGERYYRFNFAREFASAAQQRQAAWGRAKALAASATMQIVGDPSIVVNDLLGVRAYQGGSTTSAGRALATDTPRLITYVSGNYNVLGYVHTIENGTFTTELTLKRGVQFDQEPSADASNDAGLSSLRDKSGTLAVSYEEEIP